MDTIDIHTKPLIKEFDSDGTETSGSKQEYDNRLRHAAKRILPWGIALLFLVYLFHSIDMKLFLDAFLKADPGIYIPWLIIFGIAAFAMDVQNLWYLLLQFNYEVPLRKLFHIRGVSYLAMIVNYTLGIGSISLFLKRDAEISLVRSASVLLVYNSATQNCLAFMTVAGSLFYQGDSGAANSVFILSSGILIVSIVIIAILKYLNEKKLLSGFTGLDIVKVFYELPWKSYGLITFWRGVYYMTFLVFFYYATRAFNMEIPIAALAVYVPMILLIISLPVTPFGLGTSQGAMVLFFKDYGSEATILAFSIAYSTSVIIVRGMIGLLFLTKFQERFLKLNMSNGE